MKRIIRFLLCLLILCLFLMSAPANAFALDTEGFENSTQAAEPMPDSNDISYNAGQNSAINPPLLLSIADVAGGESSNSIPVSNASAESVSPPPLTEAQNGNAGGPEIAQASPTAGAPDQANLTAGNEAGENPGVEGTAGTVPGDSAADGTGGADNTKGNSGFQSTGDQELITKAPEDPAAEPGEQAGTTKGSESGESSDDGEDETEKDEGNLSAEKEGIILEGSGEFDVLIEGTLKSGEVPILINNDVNPDNVQITVWEIESPIEVSGEEHVVLEETAEGAPPEVTADSEKIEENIYYIIKIEPSKATISLCKSNGDALDKSHGYDVAKENETVIMKVTIPDGYLLKDAWRDDDKEVRITPGGDGNYYIEVFRGGGIYLSVELDKKDDDDAADDGYVFCVPVPCTPFTCTCPDEICEIVFDLNGGELNGDQGPIRFQKKCGESMQLLEAPVRPGYRFVCWATSPKCSCVKASAPGETFTVRCDVTFIAVWEAIGSVAPVMDDGDDDDDDDDDVTETVKIHANSGESIEREISGSIKVENDPAKGVSIDAAGSGDSAVELEVGGKIEVTGKEQGAVGVSVKTDGVKLKADVEAEDGMTVKSDGASTGIRASASNGGKLEVEFEGNIDVSSSSGNSVGVTVTADPACSATVEVEGNLKSDGKGVILHTDNGRVELRIGEDKEVS